MERELQKRLLHSAYCLALRSKDPSTQNGALLVEPDGRSSAEGWNRFPDGVKDLPERWERPLKYSYVQHAERDAILQAAARGVKTTGLTLVCPFLICSDCSKAVIAAGIKKCVTHLQCYEKMIEPWKSDAVHGFQMLEEAGVKVEWFDGRVGMTDVVRFNGVNWCP